jgi:fucose permease
MNEHDDPQDKQQNLAFWGIAVGVTTLAIGFVFFVNGIVFASWATNIPFIQERFALTKAEVGTLLLIMAAGAVAFMTVTAFLVQIFGSRRIAIGSTLTFACALAIALAVENLVLFVLSIITLGAANGSMDVAMNQQASLMEKRRGKPLMSRLHGCFSIGALVGAVSTFIAVRLGATPFQQTACIFLLICLLGFVLFPHLIVDKVDSIDRADRMSLSKLKHRGLIGLGFLSFLSMMSEGAIADWSTLFLVEYSGFSLDVAALGFATYAGLMIVGRFSGDQLTVLVGHRVLILISGVLTCLGTILVLGQINFVLQFIGFGLLGFGIANLVPVVFSNAGQLKGVTPGVGIAFVSVAGYSGFLIGPAVIGWFAEVIGLDKSLLIVLFSGAIFALASRYFPRRLQ